MLKKLAALSALCLAVAVSGLQAQQDVFAMSGPGSAGTNVFGYIGQPLALVSGFPAGQGAFLVLSNPTGTAFYVVSHYANQGVTVTGNRFVTAQPAGSFALPPTAAAMSPDGKKLLVAAGTLHIIDTGTNTELVAGGVSVGASANIFDVAVSLDGKTIFTLSTVSGGSQLNSIDPTSFAVTGTLAILGNATALAVGPNNLVYVCTQNQILEVNPTTLTTTTNGVISLNALPGRPVFTPDGQYLMTPNQTPATGSAVLLVSLASHNVTNTVPNFGVIIDRIVVVNSTTFLASSSQTHAMYQIAIAGGNLTINGYNLTGITTNAVTAITVSDEVGAGLRTTPRSLYVINGGLLDQLDFASSAVTGQLVITDPNSVGALSYAGAASSGTAPTQFLTYGTNQSIAGGATSLPIVFQALDQNGRPVFGASLTLSASVGTLSTTSVTTGTNGYAVTYLTAPGSSGTAAVTATSGTLNATVNVNVTSGSGTGGGTSSVNLNIIGGQGQILQQNFSTVTSNSPLLAQVTDANGNPIAGVLVTFSVSQGPGSVEINTTYGSSTVAGTLANSYVVTTDINGKAAVDFLASQLTLGTAFSQTQVTVSAPGTNTLIYYVTTVSPGGSNFPPPPTAFLITPNPGFVLAGQAGTTLPAAVDVRISSGQGTPIPNVSVVLSNGGQDPTRVPSASCAVPAGTVLLTDANGNATCNVVLGPVLGTATITPIVGVSLTTPTFVIQVSPGPPGVVKIVQGNNQTGGPGQLLNQALVVQVTDSAGNILSGVPVTWQVLTQGGVTLSNVINTTDVSGKASALATLGTVAGTAQVKVTAGTVSATFSLTVNIPAAGIQKVSGDGQSTLINTAFGKPLVVKIVDSKGNAVNGVAVTFAVTGGSGSLGTASATTDANGQASTAVTAGATAGTLTVSASTVGVSAVSFTLTILLPGPNNVTFSNGASFQSTISPGCIVLVTGVNIAPAVQGIVTAFSILGPLPTALAGVTITFNGIAAPIYYVSNAGAQQTVAVQVPFEVQPGSVSVLVNSAAGGSATFTAQVQALAPGIFTTGNQSIAVVVRSDGSYVSAANPAHLGETVQLYVTGLGQVTPATATGDAGIPGQLLAAPTLLIGLNNAGIPFISASYAPGMVGVYVITFQIPATTQPGAAVPIGVEIFDAAGNVYYGQSAFIPIS